MFTVKLIGNSFPRGVAVISFVTERKYKQYFPCFVQRMGVKNTQRTSPEHTTQTMHEAYVILI